MTEQPVPELKLPERIWLPEKALYNIGPPTYDPQARGAYYIREPVATQSPEPPSADVEAVAAQIVKDWAEHDMDEHYGSDYLRNGLGSDQLESRVAAALTTAQAKGAEQQREVDAGIAHMMAAGEDATTGRLKALAIEAAIRAGGKQ